MARWLWLCPIVGLAAAAILLRASGIGWLSALGIAFLVSCPAVALWTVREARASFGARDRLLEQLAASRRTHG